MNKKEIIKKFAKYNITALEGDDFSFVNQSGYYKYRKLKTKLFPSSGILLSELEKYYRFDLLVNRTFYKFLRPIEKLIKEKILNNYMNTFKGNESHVVKDVMKDYIDYLLSKIDEMNFKSDKKNKVISYTKEIIIDSNKKYNEDKTIRRYFDEMSFSNMENIFQVLILLEMVVLTEFKNNSKANKYYSINFIKSVRNSVMHFNIGFNIKKLESDNYWTIINNFINVASTLITDLNEDKNMGKKYNKNFIRDININVEKIDNMEIKKFIHEQIDPTHERNLKIIKVVNEQSKKNLRQRFLKIHHNINKKSKYNIGFHFVGSLSKGADQVKHKAGNKYSYDLNVDLIIKTKDLDDDIIKDIIKVVNEVKRSNESIELKKRAIRICISENGYSYNYDISIKRYEDNSIVEIN